MLLCKLSLEGEFFPAQSLDFFEKGQTFSIVSNFFAIISQSLDLCVQQDSEHACNPCDYLTVYVLAGFCCSYGAAFPDLNNEVGGLDLNAATINDGHNESKRRTV